MCDPGRGTLCRPAIYSPSSSYGTSSVSPYHLFQLKMGLTFWNVALSFLSALAFIAAVVLTLVPSPLIEPRYFIIPTVLLALHLKAHGSPRDQRQRWKAQAIIFVGINGVALHAFLYRTFEEHGETQRFMW